MMLLFGSDILIISDIIGLVNYMMTDIIKTITTVILLTYII
jgi:hypothetical protein